VCGDDGKEPASIDNSGQARRRRHVRAFVRERLRQYWVLLHRNQHDRHGVWRMLDVLDDHKRYIARIAGREFRRCYHATDRIAR